MKFFFALILAAIVVAVSGDMELSEERKARAREFAATCIKEHNISEEEALKLRNKDFTNPSEHLKCFANCFFEKVGTFKDGELQEDVLLEKFGALIGEDKTKKFIEKCKSVKGANACDTAFKLYECYENALSDIQAKSN